MAARSDDVFVHKANSRPTFDGEPRVLWSNIVSCYEVGQSTVELGSELHLCSQRRLEEDSRIAVSIERRDVVMRDLFEVFSIRLRGSDLHNAVTPLLLGGQNHVLRHLGRVRHGGMMKVDAQFALRIKEVTEGVLHFHFGALWSGEEIIAHGHGRVARSDDLFVYKANSRPTFDGEALVLWSNIPM